MDTGALFTLIGIIIGTGVAVITVLVTLILRLHADMSRRIDEGFSRVDDGFRHLNDRLDRHLEGHAPKIPQA